MQRLLSILAVLGLWASAEAGDTLQDPCLNPVRVLAAPSGQPVVLVKDGTTAATIVIAEKAWKSKGGTEHAAAAELADCVKLATGAALPIVADTTNTSGTVILVGESRLAQEKGISAADLPAEGFRDQQARRPLRGEGGRGDQETLAQWRVDWRESDGLTSSWEMLVEQGKGDYEKYAWFGGPVRTFAAKDMGRYGHTCWVDRSGGGHLRPTANHDFLGPAILYPVNRVQQTPLDRFTVVDMVRATLGMGPCEYILDVEGQRAVMKGMATCGARAVLGDIYKAKQQKAKRAEIEKALVAVVVFVKDIRARIDQYVAFSRGMRDYLGEQEKAQPELTPFLQEMDKIVTRIETSFAQHNAVIQEPQYVVDLTEKFRRTLIDYEGPDALDKCNAITNAIVKMGGTQDDVVAGSRQTVKILRQRAGLVMATDPRAVAIAKEIRRRTQEILRKPTTYEHPRP